MDGAGARNYAEEVAAGWRIFFEQLPARTLVLDLCTGNGAIALIAAEVSRRKANDMIVVGVDQADIDPLRYVDSFREDLETIEFKAGVRVEKLPFADRSAGAVVSQYGIEYSQMDRSLAEVGRVLSPGGRLRFVVHAAEGAIAAGAEKSVKEADFLLVEVDLTGMAGRCLQAVLAVERDAAAPPTKKRIAEEGVEQFRAALATAARQAEAATDQTMIRTAISVLTDTYSKRGYFELPQLLKKVDEVRTEIVAHRGRSLALVEAALSEEDLKVVDGHFRSAGLEMRHSPLKKQERLIGYVLDGGRSV